MSNFYGGVHGLQGVQGIAGNKGKNFYVKAVILEINADTLEDYFINDIDNQKKKEIKKYLFENNEWLAVYFIKSQRQYFFSYNSLEHTIQFIDFFIDPGIFWKYEYDVNIQFERLLSENYENLQKTSFSFDFYNSKIISQNNSEKTNEIYIPKPYKLDTKNGYLTLNELVLSKADELKFNKFCNLNTKNYYQTKHWRFIDINTDNIDEKKLIFKNIYTYIKEEQD